MKKKSKLDEFMKRKNIKTKEKGKKKAKDLPAKKRDALIDKMLEDFGYVD